MMNKAANDNAEDLTSTIITLIRRGESIPQIAAMLNVKRSSVEKVMDWYVERMMR